MPLAVREISAAASTRYQEPCLAFNTSTSPPEVSNKSYSAVRDEYYGQLLDLVDALSKTSSGGLGNVPIADSLPHPVESADALSQNQINELEAAYERLGAWKGSSRLELDFWKHAGDRGIRWLIGRLRNEDGNETLDGASNLLAKLGPDVFAMIIRSLDAQTSADQAYYLLNAIARMQSRRGLVSDRLLSVLLRYVRHPNMDVREAAISATAALPSEKAINVLRTALNYETDRTLISAIKEGLNERGRG